MGGIAQGVKNDWDKVVDIVERKHVGAAALPAFRAKIDKIYAELGELAPQYSLLGKKERPPSKSGVKRSSSADGPAAKRKASM
eukprot:NODE_4642_length_340_cov_212.701031_g4035_i0.p2 GENE.NODE_4642_length_340_cov_212.701031_g4035_i0~~NODE_4642_length_340_cov_212.701031_g4035_i0.p2  ORF type:complete len:93 (+),score=37.81 NODE_4642_length_340_cov_212.701031_g4035_i0:31-279(+)